MKINCLPNHSVKITEFTHTTIQYLNKNFVKTTFSLLSYFSSEIEIALAALAACTFSVKSLREIIQIGVGL